MKFPLTVVLIAISLFDQRFDHELNMLSVPVEVQQKTETPASLPDIHALIETVAAKYSVPAEFVKSIVAVESNFNPLAVSAKGAIGLMQLMPSTAREYGGDPRIPEQNIAAGTRYLSFLLQRYRRSRHPLTSAIAAYNAGQSAVDHYRGVPPFHETRKYVARVLAFLHKYRKVSSPPPSVPAGSRLP
jgi:soluble lytic murein transglycosylase-like protein